MANPTCTQDSLIAVAACFKCMDSHQRQALMVYLKVLELAAIGGEDYTGEMGHGGALNTDSAAFKVANSDERNLMRLAILSNNADAAGAEVPTTANALIAEFDCLLCFDENALDRMDLLLTCQLGVHKSYPQ